MAKMSLNSSGAFYAVFWLISYGENLVEWQLKHRKSVAKCMAWGLVEW